MREGKVPSVYYESHWGRKKTEDVWRQPSITFHPPVGLDGEGYRGRGSPRSGGRLSPPADPVPGSPGTPHPHTPHGIIYTRHPGGSQGGRAGDQNRTHRAPRRTRVATPAPSCASLRARRHRGAHAKRNSPRTTHAPHTLTHRCVRPRLTRVTALAHAHTCACTCQNSSDTCPRTSCSSRPPLSIHLPTANAACRICLSP